MLNQDQFAALNDQAKVGVARLMANHFALMTTCAQCDPHGDLRRYSDAQMIDLAQAHYIMGGQLFESEATMQALVNQIMSERLFNPVSECDVEPDDVYAYLGETDAPSVDGFKEWLKA